jgi:hypothetical protein
MASSWFHEMVSGMIPGCPSWVGNNSVGEIILVPGTQAFKPL